MLDNETKQQIIDNIKPNVKTHLKEEFSNVEVDSSDIRF